MNVLSLRFILVGNSSVGKTSIVDKYTENIFRDIHQSTMGVDYKIKIFEMKGFKIRMNILDTAGQERYKSLAKIHFRNCNGIFLVFDLTCKQSFEDLEFWLNEIKSSIDVENTKILIIGNKSDLKDIREVSENDISEFVEKNKLKVVQTSAKNGDKVKEAFEAMIDLVIENQSEEEIYKNYCNNYNKKKLLKNNKNNVHNSNAQCC